MSIQIEMYDERFSFKMISNVFKMTPIKSDQNPFIHRKYHENTKYYEMIYLYFSPLLHFIDQYHFYFVAS